MVHPAHLPRIIVIKAKHDTIALIVGATAATFALSYAIHSRPTEQTARAQQDWMGDLPAMAPKPVSVQASESITSASLVVPESALALPEMRVRPLIRLHGCEGTTCVAKASVPTPHRRPVVLADNDLEADDTVLVQSPAITSAQRITATGHEKPSLMSRLNPLNHLPDVSTIKRPFASAGDTVTGWFKRF